MSWYIYAKLNTHTNQRSILLVKYKIFGQDWSILGNRKWVNLHLLRQTCPWEGLKLWGWYSFCIFSPEASRLGTARWNESGAGSYVEFIHRALVFALLPSAWTASLRFLSRCQLSPKVVFAHRAVWGSFCSSSIASTNPQWTCQLSTFYVLQK